jgi:hypothetical protein
MRFDICDFLETCAAVAVFVGFVTITAYAVVGGI